MNEAAAPSAERLPSGVGAALRITPFRHLFLNTFLTWFGSGFLMITIQDFVLRTLEAQGALDMKVRAVGLVAFFSMAPIFLFSLFAGVLADRVDRRWLLITGQSVRALLAVLLCMMYIAGQLTITRAYVLSFVIGTAQAFIHPTRHSLVPNLVPKTYLLNAVALTNLAQHSTMVLAPVAAGLVIKRIGLGPSLAVHAVILGMAVVPLVLMRLPASALDNGVPVPGHAGLRGVLTQVGEGLRDCWRNRVLRTLLFATAMPGLFFMGPFSALAPLLARDVYGSDVSGQGLMMGVMGGGLILGGLAVAQRHDLTGLGWKMVVVLAIGGAVFLAIGTIPVLWVGLILMFFWGAGGGVFFNLNLTLMQREVDDAMRGRVMSITTLFTQGCGPIGNLFSTGLAAYIGARTTVALGVQHTIQVAGVCVVAAMLSLIVLRVRVLRMD